MAANLSVPELIALDVIASCATSNGLFASAPPDGYTMVFSRDAMITLLGAFSYRHPLVDQQFEKSLVTLGLHQAPSGQIPNAVDLFDPKRKKEVSFATIDSTLWWLIGLKTYCHARKKTAFFKRFSKQVENAFHWLLCQDTGEDGMPEQHPTSDWQDAFPHKYGHTINTQALYFHALNLYGRKKQAQQVSDAVNGKLRPDWSLWDDELGYYRPWRWKSHDQFHETENWFDTTGNLLAILFDLASPRQAELILSYIEQHHINAPFPIRVIFPAITPRTHAWQDYYKSSAAGKPFHYLNGGIWPFVGGLYVTALVKLRRFAEAERELHLLEKSNLLNPNQPFPEWIHPYTQETFGVQQAWSAGTYLLAKKSVETKKPLF